MSWSHLKMNHSCSLNSWLKDVLIWWRSNNISNNRLAVRTTEDFFFMVDIDIAIMMWRHVEWTNELRVAGKVEDCIKRQWKLYQWFPVQWDFERAYSWSHYENSVLCSLWCRSCWVRSLDRRTLTGPCQPQRACFAQRNNGNVKNTSAVKTV